MSVYNLQVFVVIIMLDYIKYKKTVRTYQFMQDHVCRLVSSADNIFKQFIYIGVDPGFIDRRLKFTKGGSIC